MELMELLSIDLHLALAPILKNKPENPLFHLTSHFREQAALPGSSPVSSAYRTLRLCPANSQHCEGNIMQAFKTLGAATSGHVSADEFVQLVSMLVDPLPDDLNQHMTLLFSRLARLSPSFATFRAAAKSCMLLEQLSAKDPLRRPSEQMFQEAEAKKLLAHLLNEENWFAALQPVAESCDVVVLSGAAGAPACQPEHEAALQEEAGRLVAMALASVRRSEDT